MENIRAFYDKFYRDYLMCIVLVVFVINCSGETGEESLNARDIKYQAFLLKNYQKADYLVPDSEVLPAQCDKISPEAISFQTSLDYSGNLNSIKSDCESKRMTCRDISFQGVLSKKETWGLLRAPLFSLEKWDELFPNIPIKINGMFFEVEHLEGWPHLMPCTNIFGFAKATNDHLIGNPSDNYPLDYFVIEQHNPNFNSIALVSSTELTSDMKTRAAAILNGFIIVKEGKYIFKHKSPPNNPDFKRLGYCEDKNGRLMVGFKNNDMIIFNVLNTDKKIHGATCKELAEIAINKYGVTDLFAFDSGGSASVLVKDVKSQKILYKTPPSDKQGYRPLPSILGITPEKMEQFSILPQNVDSVD